MQTKAYEIQNISNDNDKTLFICGLDTTEEIHPLLRQKYSETSILLVSRRIEDCMTSKFEATPSLAHCVQRVIDIESMPSYIKTINNDLVCMVHISELKTLMCALRNSSMFSNAERPFDFASYNPFYDCAEIYYSAAGHPHVPPVTATAPSSYVGILHALGGPAVPEDVACAQAIGVPPGMTDDPAISDVSAALPDQVYINAYVPEELQMVPYVPPAPPSNRSCTMS